MSSWLWWPLYIFLHKYVYVCVYICAYIYVYTTCNVGWLNLPVEPIREGNSTFPGCLFQCRTVPAVNKLFCHEFQSTLVWFVKEGQRDQIVSFFSRSLFRWNKSNPTNSEFMLLSGGGMHPATFGFFRGKKEKGLCFFTKTMPIFVMVSISKRKVRHFLTMSLPSFITVANPKALQQQKRLWENKRQALFYTTLNMDSPAMGLLFE